jgi:hypothetical protein
MVFILTSPLSPLSNTVQRNDEMIVCGYDITKQQYVEYLICTFGNYTSSNIVEHLDEVSHDVVTDHLRSEHLIAHGVREMVAKLIQDRPEDFMLVDDSVRDRATHSSSNW